MLKKIWISFAGGNRWWFGLNNLARLKTNGYTYINGYTHFTTKSYS
jgi:hypothetical protein